MFLPGHHRKQAGEVERINGARGACKPVAGSRDLHTLHLKIFASSAVKKEPIEGDEHVMENEQKNPRLDYVLEQTGMKKKKSDVYCSATSSWYYIKHVGFNNIEVTIPLSPP